MEQPKAYANRKKVEDRPEGDFYATPRSLMWVAESLFKDVFWISMPILDPCCGNGVMGQELSKMGFRVDENDLYKRDGVDYLEGEWNQRQVVMNPPFSQWDAFVEKAKSHASKVMAIGRLNYLSTQSRYQSDIWTHLKSVNVFTRYVDYQTPERDDGCFCVGAMATGWFVWDMFYDGCPMLSFLDVQKYATLGNFKKKK